MARKGVRTTIVAPKALGALDYYDTGHVAQKALAALDDTATANASPKALGALAVALRDILARWRSLGYWPAERLN